MKIENIKTGINYKKIGLTHCEKINIIKIVSNNDLICGNGQTCGGDYAIYYYVIKNNRNYGSIHITNENSIISLDEALKCNKIYQ